MGVVQSRSTSSKVPKPLDRVKDSEISNYEMSSKLRLLNSNLDKYSLSNSTGKDLNRSSRGDPKANSVVARVLDNSTVQIGDFTNNNYHVTSKEDHIPRSNTSKLSLVNHNSARKDQMIEDEKEAIKMKYAEIAADEVFDNAHIVTSKKVSEKVARIYYKQEIKSLARTAGSFITRIP